ncbi:hypothetical protein JI739_12950 [Ramlibacter sp. AW1]|uniref:Uncharacterized protein n=1 Tax=Ramlibacter aurantiacus TaxID=2801330 RepID=A0A936ZU88_9BURK|nr:hypothetical protein [Ramlibacter aurantiacus]MBL0421260.1 hypothetical protein [Ramlibacter aurantiacus]
MPTPIRGTIDHESALHVIAAAERRNLAKALERFIPPTAGERESRIQRTAIALHKMSVTREDVTSLVAASRTRDAWRNGHVVFRTLLSFFPAALSGWLLVNHPIVNKDDYAGDAAHDAAIFNHFLSYLVAVGWITLGGALASRVAEGGKLMPKYNKPAPIERDGKQVPDKDTTGAVFASGLQFWPFALGHSMVGAGLFGTSPQQLAPAYVVSTMCSSVATAVSTSVVEACRTEGRRDSVFLDASTPEKEEALKKAIEDLRQGTWEAIKGYGADLATGFASALREPVVQLRDSKHAQPAAASVPLEPGEGPAAPETRWQRPDWDTVKDITRRGAATVYSTAGRAIAPLAHNPTVKMALSVGAGLWLGLSWGWVLGAVVPPRQAAGQPAAAQPASARAVAAIMPATATVPH